MNTENRVSASTFAVPVAVSDRGGLARPDEAEEGQRYRCPGCGRDVILRRGEHRRPHFAHRGGDGCSAESVLHRAGKHQLVRIIEEWKSGGGPRPCVSRPCPAYSCGGGIVQDIPDDVTHALEEVRLPEGTIADVVLYRGDVPAVAIEVLVTHPVGLEKAARFSRPWMELRAEDLLERPYWWVAVADGLRPFACPACAKRDEVRTRELDEIRMRALVVAERLDLTLPPNPPYECVAHPCWRCAAEMVVFLWPGSGKHSARRPPRPTPSSVQYRATDAGGDYWANCCPRCATVQGDFYLSTENADYVKVRRVYEDFDTGDYW